MQISRSTFQFSNQQPYAIQERDGGKKIGPAITYTLISNLIGKDTHSIDTEYVDLYMRKRFKELRYVYNKQLIVRSARETCTLKYKLGRF